MAVNIFEKYGIKEVANVYVEALADEGSIKAGDPVLFFDTLKVSTIETTAESVSAQGGWGNPKLVTWDYGKEMTLSLTDALMSFESLRMMMGGKLITPNKAREESVIIRHSEQASIKEDGAAPKLIDHLDDTIEYELPEHYTFINATQGVRGNEESIADVKKGDIVRFFWEEEVEEEGDSINDAVEITISPNTFPGTYRLVGETFIRSERTGKDEAFQFVINKAKFKSEITLTLEAEGDPSTFDMSIDVLRSVNERGEYEMMKLIRYGKRAEESSDEQS